MKKYFISFCKPTVGFLTAALALTWLLLGATSCVSKTKTIGIQLYSVMNAVMKDPKTSVERLAGMGYNAFELVQWGGDPTVFGLSANDFKTICDNNDAVIRSTHSSIQEDTTQDAEVMARWRTLFETQKACGGTYFVIPSYRVDYTVEAVQRMCDYFNRVGKIAAEYGLKLGYHNHSQEFQTLTGTDMVMWEYLVEHTDPQYVCFELDVFWCAKGGKDPVAYLKKYPKQIEILHVKDEFVIGESGTMDFEGIFNQFYANGMSEYYVEIEPVKEVREKVNEDGTPYTQDQIMEEMFEAARKSVLFLQQAKYVK